jgi:hypothetical protein
LQDRLGFVRNYGIYMIFREGWTSLQKYHEVRERVEASAHAFLTSTLDVPAALFPRINSGTRFTSSVRGFDVW